MVNSSRIIQQESSNLLTIGWSIFYPTPREQNTMLLSLLESGSSQLSEGRKKLLENALTQFAEWEHVSEILLDGESKAATISNQQEDRMEVEQHTTTDRMDVESNNNNNNHNNEKKGKRLLYAIIDYVYDEGIDLLNPSSNRQTASPLVSSALRLLLILQRDIVSNASYSDLLFDYSCTVINKSRQLLDYALSHYITNTTSTSTPLSASGSSIPPPTTISPENMERINHSLKSTLVGVTVQSLALSLFRKKYLSNTGFARRLLPHLLQLLQSLDFLNKQLPPVIEADKLYLSNSSAGGAAVPGKRDDKRAVVETKHPYPHGKHQLKQTVTFPGAEALCLHFDPRSRTASTSSDVLQLFKTSSMTETLVSSGKEGKPMIFSGNNWPKQPVIVPGNSVTFVFSGNTRAETASKSGSSASRHHSAEMNRYRWGFKCRVSEMTPTDSYKPLISHWLLDLECILSVVSGKYSSTLIEGDPLGEKEKKCMPWIEEFVQLLNGGLESENEVNNAERAFLEEFIQARGDALLLYQWMEKQRGRRMLSAYAKQPLEIAERYVIAAMMKQLCLIEVRTRR